MLLPKCDSNVEYLLAYFIHERMDIFWGRAAEEPPPYSTDPIFQQYKFTNVHRVTDRVSQYLVRNVQYNAAWNEEDLIFRTLLFKTFNLPSTWIGLLEYLGYEPTITRFDFDQYCKALDYVAQAYGVVYNNAYMQTGNNMHGYTIKYYNHMALLRDNVINPRTGFIRNAIKCNSMFQLYNLLHTLPYVADFLGYQYATDLNYAPIWFFEEDSLCMATVGSKRGIEKLLGGKRPSKYEDIVRFYVDHQENLLRTHDLYDDFVNLFGRRLQPIDMQNCFCELDKYLRVYLPSVDAANTSRKRTKIKSKFKKTSYPYTLKFPTWWSIAAYNDKYSIT